MGPAAHLHYLEPETVTPPREGLRVREITAKSALSIAPLPGLDYGLNPFHGCCQGCTFCYVPSLLHRPMEEWGTYVGVKRNAPTILAHEVRRLPRGLVAISTATDPYQYLEVRYRVTRFCLEVLAKVDWPISVLTRSPLVLRDVDLLRRFTDVRVGMSVPTLDDAARRILEPYAPSIDARLQALRRLADEGFETFISFAPVYPPTGGWSAPSIAEALAEAGVRSVSMRSLDLRPGMRSVLLDRMRRSDLGEQLRHITDVEVIYPFITALGRELIGRGVEVHRRGRDFGPAA